MNNKIKRCAVDIIIFAILVFIDRLTKNWAVQRLKGNEPISLVKGVLELHYLPAGNSGAAFGMLSGHIALFLVIASVVVIAIAYFIWNMPSDSRYKIIEILMVFIAAGGVGNMIDRIAQGYVVDFIYISCINFPIFNVADMYVSVCTVLLAIIVLFRLKEDDYERIESSLSLPFGKSRNKDRS